jgi:hypothetical protein
MPLFSLGQTSFVAYVAFRGHNWISGLLEVEFALAILTGHTACQSFNMSFTPTFSLLHENIFLGELIDQLLVFSD